MTLNRPSIFRLAGAIEESRLGEISTRLQRKFVYRSWRRRPHADGAKASSKLGPEIRADKKLTSREQIAAFAAYQG